MPRPHNYLTDIWPREHAVWRTMRQRCLNTGNPRYAGRGIRCCDAWLRSFENFILDMGTRPGPLYSLERKDNNGDYCKDNCVWALKRDQANNTSANHLVTYAGRTATTAEMARLHGIPYKRLMARLARGWSIEAAMRTPCGPQGHRRMEAAQ